jgi:VanZ family protein
MKTLTLVVFVAVAMISLLASTSYGVTIAHLVQQIPGGDKTGHFVLMGLVSFVTVAAAIRLGTRRPRANVMIGFSLVGVFATLDEVLQLVLPRRTFSWTDLSASYAGVVVLGALAWALVHPTDPRDKDSPL